MSWCDDVDAEIRPKYCHHITILTPKRFGHHDPTVIEGKNRSKVPSGYELITLLLYSSNKGNLLYCSISATQSQGDYCLADKSLA